MDEWQKLQQLLNPGGLGGMGQNQMPYMGPYSPEVYSQAQQNMGQGGIPGLLQGLQGGQGQGAPGGMWNSMNDWWSDNGQMVGGVMGGLGTLGNLWTGMEGLKLGKKQFKFQKNAYNENMNMQKQDLNRKLESNWRDMEATGNQGNYKSLEDYLGKHRFT